MSYQPSVALDAWLGTRRSELLVLEEAHQKVSQATAGTGRPRQRGGDHLAQAFIVRIYAEFQAFVRDLHDICVNVMVRGLDVPQKSHAPLVASAILGRGIDHGNAGLTVIFEDFKRLNVGTLRADVSRLNPSHGQDQATYESLTRLRNAIAHGNTVQLADLHRKHIRPTLTYGRKCLPALNRTARALDRAVWDHARASYPQIIPW